MNAKVTIFVSFVIVGALVLLLAGCYTQVGTKEEPRPDDGGQSYQPQGQGDQGDEYYDNDYYWQNQSRMGFSYYYPPYNTLYNSPYWPSSYFSAAYDDPFF